MKPFRVQVQGRGMSAELALVRNRRVFAYVVPADPRSEKDRMAVAEFGECMRLEQLHRRSMVGTRSRPKPIQAEEGL